MTITTKPVDVAIDPKQYTRTPKLARAILACVIFLPLGLVSLVYTRAYWRDPNAAKARFDAVRAREMGTYAFSAGLTVAILALVAAFLLVNDAAIMNSYFDPEVLVASAGPIFLAFLTNLWVSIIAEVGILIWALILVVLRSLPGRAFWPVRLLVIAYIDLFRGLPALLTILLIGFGLPATGLPMFVDMPLIQTGAVALVVVYGAYVAEIFRSAVSSIPAGQMAAATSLGFGYIGAMRDILLPQALRNSLPSLLSWYISVLKDTSLLSVLGLMEGLSTARLWVNFSSNLSPLVGISLCFLLVTLPLSRFTDWIIARNERTGKGKA